MMGFVQNSLTFIQWQIANWEIWLSKYSTETFSRIEPSRRCRPITTNLPTCSGLLSTIHWKTSCTLCLCVCVCECMIVWSMSVWILVSKCVYIFVCVLAAKCASIFHWLCSTDTSNVMCNYYRRTLAIFY